MMDGAALVGGMTMVVLVPVLCLLFNVILFHECMHALVAVLMRSSGLCGGAYATLFYCNRFTSQILAGPSSTPFYYKMLSKVCNSIFNLFHRTTNCAMFLVGIVNMSVDVYVNVCVLNDSAVLPRFVLEDEMEKKRRQRKVVSEKGSSANGGPDTSSFTAFLFSLLSCSEAGVRCADDHGRNDENYIEMNEPNAIPSASRGRIMGRRKQKIAMAKHSSSKTAHQGRSTSRFEAQCSGQEKGHVGSDDEGDWQLVTEHDLKSEKGLESMPQVMLPEMSEPSLLLSECLRSFLYSTLPTLAQGRTWVLLYSTWRHGVSLLTLYRRSSFCPGPCLLRKWRHMSIVIHLVRVPGHYGCDEYDPGKSQYWSNNFNGHAD
eukprot:Gb_27847 [translate_table: standard]